MADVSERPAVCAMGSEMRPDFGIRRGFRGTEHDRSKAGAAAYGSRLPRLGGSQAIPPEERWQAIAVTAYHLARRSGFIGKPVKYWLAAEAEVDAELATQRSTIV
uniref:DUF2934 domain-containing protein n=2 Tax=unclassified Candidatus Kentrum TaxID=2643149 RepID=A0A451APK3_9GAMM|nr:MAG: Protein of unknown function (DUF2934) [Candidatus Kentron sp. LPFa]VFK33949.1 MAG: Protein of unknown function (DUF2934) [Candidatus Kentron sp. LPFa]VFK67935.1 MAG: Protein of unknown function (DUF2934) [Candidatus Kentron sp. UNK]VFK73235.1 MAG: Protein of unknown function (DUF2934) [Candidatus Kentron sp. UNK]